MKRVLIFIVGLLNIACFNSCSKDKAVNCAIVGETDTAISGLSSGSTYAIVYQYDNRGRLVNVNNASGADYTYGNGFVTFPDRFMGPPDTVYLNSNGYPSVSGDITYSYDNENHLIKESYASGGYQLFTWQNGDQISCVAYSSNGTKTGGASYYTYYDSIAFQLTKPNYIYLGVSSRHMLQNETDVTNYTNVLGNYSYSYFFDRSGRVSGYKLYDIEPASSSKPDTDVWVTQLSYNCND